MMRFLLLITISFTVLFAQACRSRGSSGSPGITRSSGSSNRGSGSPGIWRPTGGGAGHTPGISGPKRSRDNMSGPTRQHGKR